MGVSLSARGVLVRSFDVLPWIVGGTLLGLGLTGLPALAAAGGLVLTLAGLVYLARAQGYVLPRPGLVRIASRGCWETPLAFFVRYQDRPLLFHRGFEGVSGERPEGYCVVALPPDWGGRTGPFASFEPPEDSRLLGLVPVRDLRFEHRGGDYVDRASLAAALRRLAP